MENKENEKERNISFAERVIAKVRNILDKYMEGFTRNLYIPRWI